MLFFNILDSILILINHSKDSIVTNFIENTGSYPCSIKSIYIQGADESAFSLVGGLPPYTIVENDSHFGEFSFQPLEAKDYQAEIVIITQADTLYQNIYGRGIEENLKVINNWIDFGAVLINEYKDTLQAVTVKNVSSKELEVLETKHNYPNAVDFETRAGGGNFILQPGDTCRMDLRYTANTIGRTSGTLEFHYNGIGSPAIVNLFAQSIDQPKLCLSVDDFDSPARRVLFIPVMIDSIRSIFYSGITHLKTDLTFNPTILYPRNHKYTTENEKTARITLDSLSLEDKQVGDTLVTIEFIVGLGNAPECDFLLENYEAIGGDVDITVIDGHFELLGVCEEGGTRLINPTGEAAGIVNINPNPATEEVNIKLNFIETGKAEVAIYNYMGEKISTIFEEEIIEPREQYLKVSVSDYNSGLYFVVFESATIRETKEVMLVR